MSEHRTGEVEFLDDSGAPVEDIEELPQPAEHPTALRVGAALGVVAVVAAVVVGIATRDTGGRPSAVPSATALPSGPVIPTFVGGGGLDGDGYGETPKALSTSILTVGRPARTVTLYGYDDVPRVSSSACLGDGGPGVGCQVNYHVPRPLVAAVHKALAGIPLAGQSIVRRIHGHTRIVDRIVVGSKGPRTIVVRVARTHSATAAAGTAVGGHVAYADVRHGALTVQVLVQTTHGPLPEPATVAKLARDEALTALP